jgi:hypothetical protein
MRWLEGGLTMWRSWYAGACVFLAGVAAPATGAVKLQWQLKPGDIFFVDEKTVQKQTMKFMGSTIKQDLSHTRVTRFTVLEKTAKGLVLEQTISKVRIDRTGGTGQTDAKLLRGLEGARFKVTLDPDLHVSRFEGYEEFIKKFQKEEAVARMIRLLMPEVMFSQAAENVFAVVPNRAVDKGARWSRQAVRPLGPLGQLKLEETYTFQGPARGEGKDVVQIDMALAQSTYQPPAKADILEFRIVKGDLGADKKNSSRTIYFNPATGRLIRSVGSVQLSGRLTIAAMGQTLKMEIEQDESTMTRLLDKNPLE